MITATILKAVMIGNTICGCAFIFAIVVLPTTAEYDNATINDLMNNGDLNLLQIAKRYKYPAERHWVLSEDGYTIEMHRIPYGRYNNNPFNRPPVLIGHGTGGSGREYVLTGNKSIAFTFCEAGYDVWIGNARGTEWSRKHEKLSYRSKEYWEFGWHEIGVYDYTAEVNYITNITGQEKVFFLGHSQGGTSYLAMVIERPEMNEKIRLAMLMGPTIYTKHNLNPFMLALSENIQMIKNLMDYLHLYVMPTGPFLSRIIQLLCKSSLSFLCFMYLNITMGYDISHIDRRLIGVPLSHLPAPFAFRQLEHYAQMFNTKRFQKYDYGPEENLKRYGSVIPPLYNVSKATAPVALIYGVNDIYVNEQDANDLCKDLPHCAFNYMIRETAWNHIAYLFATNADKVVNEKLIEMMRAY